MTTSNVTTWELTRNQIIEAALRKLGVLNKGASASSTDLTNGQIALNGVMARFNTLGMPLWKRSSVAITLVDGTNSYSMTTALKLPELYLRATDGSTQYKLQLKSKYDMNSLPYNTEGIPVAWCFTPTLAEGGTLEIWPTPDASAAASYSMVAIVQEEVDNFTTAGETADFPAYWTDALVYNLAVSLAPEYGTPLNDRQLLAKEATTYLAQAQSYGDEDGSLLIMPDYQFK